MGITTNILLIEGKYSDQKSLFATPLSRRYQVTIVQTGKQALNTLSDTIPDIVVINAASMRTSGIRICDWLRQQLPTVPIIFIEASENKKRRRRGKKNKSHKADVVLYLPFHG